MFYFYLYSVAILRYLSKTRQIADHWYPADIKLQAKVDEYLEWQHTNTRIFCAMYFQHKVLYMQMLFYD
jgi:glutathione S-transferase